MSFQNAPIVSIKSGVSAVDGTGQVPGWISGDISGLAGAGSVTVLFDLGPNWNGYELVQIGITGAGPSTGVQVTSVRSSNNTTIDATKQALGFAYGITFSTASVASTLAATTTVRPIERYLAVQCTNADAVNALGAASYISLAMYPSS